MENVPFIDDLPFEHKKWLQKMAHRKGYQTNRKGYQTSPLGVPFIDNLPNHQARKGLSIDKPQINHRISIDYPQINHRLTIDKPFCLFTRPGINQQKKNNNSARLGSMISEMSRPNSWRSGNWRSSAKVKKNKLIYLIWI